VSQGTAGSRYLGFAVQAALVAVAVGAIGWWIAGSRGGPEAAVAAAVGCGIALAASLIGGVAVARRPADPRIAAVSALGANGLRLGALAALAILVAMSGRVSLKPLLLWTLGGHLALLAAVDTRYAMAEAQAGEKARAGEKAQAPRKTDAREAETEKEESEPRP
jgi:hypothetical protein